MPPPRRRGASAPDPQALASLSGPAPRLTRSADVDPVLGVGSPPAEAPAPAPPETPAPKAERSIRFGAYIKASVAEDVRDAVVALGGDWTIAALMEGALVREVQRLAEEHRGGEPFPKRSSQRLRAGRRIQ